MYTLQYKLIKERLFHEDIGAYTTYGILIFDAEDKMQRSFISDVSVDKKCVKRIVQSCIEEKIPLESIRDAIEEML